jgi:tRNA threonylcarbamoyladenosine biosynthesis protein TsaB
MRLIAIDTALEACSVCLLDTSTEAPAIVRSALMGRGHAEALVPMMAELAQEIGGFVALDRIAVTIGPGSFTGIRVGVSAARALALATGKPAVGVSTLSALAAPLLDAGEVPVAVALDARHDRVFFQLFAPSGQTMVAPRCVPVREAARAAGVGPILAVGSGAEMLAAAGALLGSRVDVAPPERALPDIAWVAQIGSVADIESSPPHPLYLRPADAQPQTASRIARQ